MRRYVIAITLQTKVRELLRQLGGDGRRIAYLSSRRMGIRLSKSMDGTKFTVQSAKCRVRSAESCPHRQNEPSTIWGGWEGCGHGRLVLIMGYVWQEFRHDFGVVGEDG